MLCTPKSNDLFLRRITTTTTTRIILSCGVLFHMILMEILLLTREHLELFASVRALITHYSSLNAHCGAYI
uniref:Uncharacterized protein n=1 Tax=Meloidogyne incognita TaxID=6306 RepID=A0A914MRQ3_MELIC